MSGVLSVPGVTVAGMTSETLCDSCRVQVGVPVEVEGAPAVRCSYCCIAAAVAGSSVVIAPGGAPRPPGIGDLPAVMPAGGLALYP